MLTTLFVTIFAKLMPVFHLDIVNKMFDAFRAVLLMCIVTYLLFKVGSIAFFKENADKRYEELYDEPIINFIRLIYVIINVLTIAKMYNNITNEMPIFYKTAILFVILVILDVANIIAGYNVYSFDVREAIIDGILLQIRNVSLTLLILAVILLILKLTIFGFVLVSVIIISIFIRK